VIRLRCFFFYNSDESGLGSLCVESSAILFRSAFASPVPTLLLLASLADMESPVIAITAAGILDDRSNFVQDPELCTRPWRDELASIDCIQRWRSFRRSSLHERTHSRPIPCK
jgi:hypothetical protein